MTLHLIGEASFVLRIAGTATQKPHLWKSLTKLLSDSDKVLLPKRGKDYWHWGIFLKENPAETIGGVDLWRNSNVDNRGFWLARRYWGKGYMTESVTRINDYAFDNLGFDVLYFGNAITNIGSRRIKEKTGAVCTGTRPFKYVDPSVNESQNWKLTKEAWQQLRNGNM